MDSKGFNSIRKSQFRAWEIFEMVDNLALLIRLPFKIPEIVLRFIPVFFAISRMVIFLAFRTSLNSSAVLSDDATANSISPVITASSGLMLLLWIITLLPFGITSIVGLHQQHSPCVLCSPSIILLILFPPVLSLCSTIISMCCFSRLRSSGFISVFSLHSSSLILFVLQGILLLPVYHLERTYRSYSKTRSFGLHTSGDRVLLHIAAPYRAPNLFRLCRSKHTFA